MPMILSREETLLIQAGRATSIDSNYGDLWATLWHHGNDVYEAMAQQYEYLEEQIDAAGGAVGKDEDDVDLPIGSSPQRPRPMQAHP